jgi:hypothetical protein
MSGPQTPWVNPHPHPSINGGHVDLQRPDGGHDYIGLGQSQVPGATDAQRALGALAIQGAYEAQVRQGRH